ncbi:hypothetical protein Agub_g5275 [Astrephomene gubernaculifera]|uniref:Uncharacterized protein n=1 Tax=Astrephomene gubernaculifera TaxID=47775 RepID=A0AAD3DM33_9CHLO|nr:hypothetical protein Agub_g5275 [Astrephomene gubernaculifera]
MQLPCNLRRLTYNTPVRAPALSILASHSGRSEGRRSSFGTGRNAGERGRSGEQLPSREDRNRGPLLAPRGPSRRWVAEEGVDDDARQRRRPSRDAATNNTPAPRRRAPAYDSDGDDDESEEQHQRPPRQQRRPSTAGRPHDARVRSRTAGDSTPRVAAADSVGEPRAEGGTPKQGSLVGFDAVYERIRGQHEEGIAAGRETWERLLGHLSSARQAAAALELMQADARVRQAAGWDWGTHGYGQTAYQLVQAAAASGAPELAEQLLDRREELHLTLNKDLIPTLMRKVAAAMAAGDGASSRSGSGAGGLYDNMDEHVVVVQRLYEQEAALRGANSPEAAYELSRVLRRAGDVGAVRSLHAQMLREGLAARDGLLEDVERWLLKRGVRVARQ